MIVMVKTLTLKNLEIYSIEPRFLIFNKVFYFNTLK